MAENIETTTTLTPATPAVKFKYGDLEFDTDKLAKYLYNNASGWLQHSGYGNNQGVIDSVNDIITRVKSGDIDAYDPTTSAENGAIHSQTGYDVSPYQKHFLGIKTGTDTSTNQVAALYLKEALLAASMLDSNEDSSDTSKVYSNDAFTKAYSNKYLGGAEATADNMNLGWFSLNKKKEDGTYDLTNTYNEFANFLDEYANSDSVLKSNYKDTAYKDSADLSLRLKNAALASRQAASDGGSEESVNALKQSLASIGINYNTYFPSNTTTNTTETNEYETVLNDYIKELDKAGITGLEREDLIAAFKRSLKESLRLPFELDLDKIKEDKVEDAWNEFAAKNFTSTANRSWSLNDYNEGKSRGSNFWWSTQKEGEKDVTPGFFDTYKTQMKLVINNFNNGIINKGKQLADGITEDEALMAYLFYDMKKNPSEYEKTGTGNYIIKSSLKKNGSFFEYNPKTRLLQEKHIISKEKTPTAVRLARLKYGQNFKVTNTSLRKYKSGGEILKAINGNTLDNFSALKVKKEKANITNKAKAEGRTYDLYLAGHHKISADPNDNWEIDLLSGTDMVRLGTMAADVTSLVASFVPVYGTAVAGIAGAASALGTIGADLFDDSMSVEDKWKSAGMAIGGAALGMIPGGKAAGLAGKVAKWVPRILNMAGAANLAFNDDIHKSLNKCLHSGEENKLTVDDWKNIGVALSTVAGLTRSATSAYKARKFKAVPTDNVEVKTSKGNVKLTKDLLTTINEAGNKGGNKAALDAFKAMKSVEGSDLKEHELADLKFGETGSNWKNGWGIAKRNVSGEAVFELNPRIKYELILSRARAMKHPGLRLATDYEIYSGQSFGPFSGVNIQWPAWMRMPKSSYEKWLESRGKTHTVELIALGNASHLKLDIPEIEPFNPQNVHATVLTRFTGNGNSGIWNRPSRTAADLRAIRKDLAWERLMESIGGSSLRLGGKINPLLSLKNGGTIIKAQSGVKFTDPARTWQLDIFSNYRLDILDRLKSNPDKMDWYNTMQHRHSQMYNAAGADKGDWLSTAYTGTIDNNANFISEYLNDYDNADLAGYNSGTNTNGKTSGYNAIANAYKTGRYTIKGKRTSGDAPSEGFKNDNLYSAITDDRRLLGRKGDWDENSDDFKKWQSDLNALGLETYLDKSEDGGDDYYKLRKLNTQPIQQNTTLNPNDNKNPGGMSGGTGNKRAGKPDNGTNPNPWKSIVDNGLIKLNPWDIALMTLGLNVNKQLENLGLQKGTALAAFTPGHLLIMGPFSKYLNALSAANDITAQGAALARNTSDYNMGMAAMLEANKNANAARMSAFTDYDNDVNLSILRSVAKAFENVDKYDQMRKENATRLAQLRNVHLDTKMGKIASDFNGIYKPWMMELSLNLKNKEVENKNNRIKLAQLKADNNKRIALQPLQDAYYSAYEKYAANPKDKTLEKLSDDAYNALQKRARDYDNNEGYQDLLNIYKTMGIDTSELENSKAEGTYKFGTGEGFLWSKLKNGGTLNKLKEFKSGGSTNKDDGPRRTRSKDLDRFQRAVKQAADSHDKALSRLAAATLLELKRSMGK